MGVSSLPKTVTRQRRDCDLNPGAADILYQNPEFFQRMNEFCVLTGVAESPAINTRDDRPCMNMQMSPNGTHRAS